MVKIKYLFAALLLVLMACSNGNATEEPTPSDSDQPVTVGRKPLIVYFSWGGNTRAVAEIIGNITGGDMVELELVEPYSTVYSELTARADEEVRNDVCPTLTTRIENLDDYDTLIIGTPIWSDHAVPAVKSFLGSYDFSGKKIASFCTHAGSGTAKSVDDVRELCPDSEILQPLAIYGNRAENSHNDVEAWLRAIDIIE
ncbi:flavodoxin [Bacteroides acidifaciens]|uniref:flavodoxin n=1 Tax=Bacteroides acidifaciens TaxID=85831 RepID=UPI002599DA6E|nr:flavodoxin [Bacteroides acidifaciens]